MKPQTKLLLTRYEFFIAPLLRSDNKQFHSYCDLQIRNLGKQPKDFSTDFND